MWINMYSLDHSYYGYVFYVGKKMYIISYETSFHVAEIAKVVLSCNFWNILYRMI